MRKALTALTVLAAVLVGAPTPSATSAAVDGADRATRTERAAALVSFRQRVVTLTNNRRRAHGCRNLRAVASLNRAAQRHTRLMANRDRMTHQFADEPDPGVRMRRAGYDWSGWAENIAYGYATPRAVVRAWMQSPGHRRNILRCRFKHIGVGYAKAENGYPYWTQDFGYR